MQDQGYDDDDYSTSYGPDISLTEAVRLGLVILVDPDLNPGRFDEISGAIEHMRRRLSEADRLAAVERCSAPHPDKPDIERLIFCVRRKGHRGPCTAVTVWDNPQQGELKHLEQQLKDAALAVGSAAQTASQPFRDAAKALAQITEMKMTADQRALNRQDSIHRSKEHRKITPTRGRR